ncbi:hypothetical protein NP493_2093g00009 [Ridgeia piscesae]|uniref:Uncharacterized protein n=1 Tax=Ridgeia piscesae TaxID=27915 RepID=A0AAD9JLF6_RIDPI|nr:hypothetical protein NP493_2093g00009 [Ridgeia piscesae]
MVLYFIASRGIHPFYDKSEFYQLTKTVENKPDLTALDNQHCGLDLVTSMLKPEPKDRPSTTVLLRHPLFWSEEKRYKLLTTVGKEAEIAYSQESQHEDNVVRRAIEGTKAVVLPNQNDWDALRNKMEKELDENNESDAKFLTRFKRAGYVESMCNLLVTLRKLHDRYDKLSPRAKAMLGNTCYPYTFFDKELPGLFLNIYTVIKESATTEDDWTKRETLMDFFSN